MDSIVPECTNLKHGYDDCFNQWFSGKYLKGDAERPSECDTLFKKYRDCITPKMNELKIKNNMID